VNVRNDARAGLELAPQLRTQLEVHAWPEKKRDHRRIADFGLEQVLIQEENALGDAALRSRGLRDAGSCPPHMPARGPPRSRSVSPQPDRKQHHRADCASFSTVTTACGVVRTNIRRAQPARRGDRSQPLAAAIAMALTRTDSQRFNVMPPAGTPGGSI
jgi:hypothetical protein